MARTTLHGIFAALLAMFSAQVAVPLQDPVPAVEIRQCEAEQHALHPQPRALAAVRTIRPMAARATWIPSEPATIARFQRPPPASLLFF